MSIAAVVVALLLLVSAILTAVHDAAFQIGRSHVRTLEEEGFDGAGALRAVRDLKVEVRAAVRVVTQLLNLSALSIIGLTSVSTWGIAGPVPSAIVGVFVVLVVADLIPHLLAATKPVRLALSGAPLLLTVERFARPLTHPVARLEDRIGGDSDSLSDAHRELREIQEIGEEEGVLEASENLLVERAFRLDELTAWDVMVPRVDIFAWQEDRTLREIVDELAAVPYSRVPVYRGSVDDVTGIVYVREAYTQVAKGGLDVTLAELAREPFFVPGSLALSHLLKGFQARRIHMGIVADEFGGTDGLVTLEDVLEELVGEIVDETDIEAEAIVRVDERVIVCDAAVDLRDLDEALGVSLNQGEHRSLNGFILDELGHVPDTGERFETQGVQIEIVEATDTQVRRAKLTRLQSPEEVVE
ncbi:MAG: hemolysin family protein [Gemmatimonadota bacterium]|nr:hemolysin family protein [Gemmatimonadota bacterium]